MRTCLTCQHIKRPEIDRRLAGGEPLTHLAKDYGLTQSSLYRHRVNCLKLASSNAIKKEAARGSAAVALLPTAATLAEWYRELLERIDQIVMRAEQEGSLRIALSGLTSLRQTFESLGRLATQDAAARAQAPEPAPGHSTVDCDAIVERLIQEFDQDPEIKARLAAALVRIDDGTRAHVRPSAPYDRTVVAEGSPRERPATGEPRFVQPVPTEFRSAIKTAQADLATVTGFSERCEAISGDGNSPSPSGGSNTAPTDADARSEVKGDVRGTPVNVTMRPPTNGCTGPATTGGLS
jgi:hypothetical protein